MTFYGVRVAEYGENGSITPTDLMPIAGAPAYWGSTLVETIEPIASILVHDDHYPAISIEGARKLLADNGIDPHLPFTPQEF